MSKRQILCLIGVWIIILPHLGLYGSWQALLFAITGVALCVLAYTGKPSRQGSSASQYSSTFSDSSARAEQEESGSAHTS